MCRSRFCRWMSCGWSAARCRRSEAGQALPLMVVFVVLVGGALVGVGRFGGEVVASARARTAADAAALAGAASGRDAASDTASANGGRLVSYAEDGADTRVVVEVRGHRVSARARSEGHYTWAGGRGGGGAGPGGLAPGLRAAIARAEQLLGRSVPITSGYRSPAQQRALWERRHTNPYPVAPPGSSKHERGLAIDVPRAFVPVLLTVVPESGLCQPYPRTDPIHFELCRA